MKNECAITGEIVFSKDHLETIFGMSRLCKRVADYNPFGLKDEDRKFLLAEAEIIQEKLKPFISDFEGRKNK